MNENIKQKAQELYPIESHANEHTAFLQGAEFAINSDFAVCSGYSCPVAERCRRNKAFRMWANTQRDKRPLRITFISDDCNLNNHNCNNFIEN